MRTTFDSNLWEHVVHPMVFPLPPDRHRRLLAVNDAVKDGRVTGFICQSVATMEGVKRKDRPEFLSQQPSRARCRDGRSYDVNDDLRARSKQSAGTSARSD